MIKIPHYQTKEASRVYGDYAILDKKAFNLSIDPANVLGAVAGGYTANRVYSKQKDKAAAKELSGQSLENNTYSQMETILRDLKIVFTPINVIYSVKGQVFEIIGLDEMNPYMKSAFQRKDADYYRDLLLNKINMEIQMAEQAFAKRLLAAGGYNGQAKQASYPVKQDVLSKVAEDELDGMMKVAKEGLPAKLEIGVDFQSLRPFSKSEVFTNGKDLEKVAGIFDVFKADNKDVLDVRRMQKEINVGFLPDRVLFLWNGQLVEQMSLMQMNSDGYKAFQEKDKQFFIDYFRKEVKDIAKSVKTTAPPPQETETVEETEAFTDVPFSDLSKDAASLEDILDDLVEEEFSVIERDSIDPFTDPDIHPMAYAKILEDRYGEDWAENEIEAIFKQIEVDFELRDGIGENAMNKINILHVLASDDHALYQAPLTFEKFMRVVNSKSVLFEEFQGDLSFEEILFGLEIAKAYDGDEVYLEFHDNIAPYVSEELFRENIRYISDQLYDEENPSEKDFFKSVNGYLSRKWKETDTQGVLDDETIEAIHISTEQITEIAEEILTHHANQIVLNDPYTSVKSIIVENGLLQPVDASLRSGVLNMAAETIVSHFLSGIFVEYKYDELDYTLEKLREAGVIRER